MTNNLEASNEFLDGVIFELEEPVPSITDDEGNPAAFFDEVYPNISQVVYDWIAQNEPEELQQ